MLFSFCDSYIHNILDLDVPSTNFVVCLMYDCFRLGQAVIEIIKIMLYFIVQVFISTFNAIAFGFGKIFLNTLYWGAWISFHFTCGILGLEDKSTSAFSWFILVVILALFCERSNQEWAFKIARTVSVYYQRLHRRLINNDFRNVQTASQVVIENQRNEHREIEPINRLLEAENQENENEENNLVEADRHRIDNDNRRNIERENGVDDQRANLENHENVERELHNTRTSLDNRRNCNQEQQRYFLRQRERNHQSDIDRLVVSQHGINAVIFPALTAYNMLPVNRNDYLSRSNTARLNV